MNRATKKSERFLQSTAAMGRSASYLECTRLLIEGKIRQIEIAWNSQESGIGQVECTVRVDIDEMMRFRIDLCTPARRARMEDPLRGSSKLTDWPVPLSVSKWSGPAHERVEHCERPSSSKPIQWHSTS